MNTALDIFVRVAFMITPVILILILLILNRLSVSIKGIRRDQVDFQNWMINRMDSFKQESKESMYVNDSEIENPVKEAVREDIGNYLDKYDELGLQPLEESIDDYVAKPFPFQVLSDDEIEEAFNTDVTDADDPLDVAESMESVPEDYDYLMDMGSEHEYDRGTYHTLRSYCACYLSRAGESLNEMGVKRFAMSARHEEMLRLLAYANLNDGFQPLSVSAVVNNILDDHFKYFKDEIYLLMERGQKNLERFENDRY